MLGPTLWNIFFDGLLELELGEGIASIAYADDIGVIVMAKDITGINTKASQALEKIGTWMNDNKLELALDKTEALMLKGPRKRDGINIIQQGKQIILKKAIKYLGVWLDTQDYYGTHVLKTAEKAESRVSALSRLMPNIGGPSYYKRRVLLEVVHSTVLYAAPLWQKAMRIARYRDIVDATQRRMLLRVTMAYRTVSGPAIQVIAGVPPMHLLAAERARIYLGNNSRKDEMKRRERMATIEIWQQEWNSEQRGKWT